LSLEVCIERQTRSTRNHDSPEGGGRTSQRQRKKSWWSRWSTPQQL